jgi:hypothetical protein
MTTWNKTLLTCITASSKARGGFHTRLYYFIPEEKSMNVMTTNTRVVEVPDCQPSADAPNFQDAYQHFIGGNRLGGMAWFIPCGCCDGEGEQTASIGPRADSYPCDSYQGYGYFEVVHSNG